MLLSTFKRMKNEGTIYTHCSPKAWSECKAAEYFASLSMIRGNSVHGTIQKFQGLEINWYKKENIQHTQLGMRRKQEDQVHEVISQHDEHMVISMAGQWYLSPLQPKHALPEVHTYGASLPHR
jgi:hypothetical protein